MVGTSKVVDTYENTLAHRLGTNRPCFAFALFLRLQQVQRLLRKASIGRARNQQTSISQRKWPRRQQSQQKHPMIQGGGSLLITKQRSSEKQRKEY